jgi:hypothetical protein
MEVTMPTAVERPGVFALQQLFDRWVGEERSTGNLGLDTKLLNFTLSHSGEGVHLGELVPAVLPAVQHEAAPAINDWFV